MQALRSYFSGNYEEINQEPPICLEEEWQIVELERTKPTGLDKWLHVIDNYSTNISLALHIQPLAKGWSVRKKVQKIKELRSEQVQILSIYDRRIDEIRNETLILKMEANKLKKERNEIDTDLKEWEYRFKILIGKEEVKSVKSPKEILGESISDLESKINEKELQERKIVEEKADAIQEIEIQVSDLISQMLGTKHKSIPALTEGPVVPAEPISKSCDSLQKLLDEVGKYTHEDLKKLLEVVFRKVDQGIVLSWEFDPTAASGKFKILLRQRVKLWIRPLFEDGSPDRRTPKGVVFLLGGEDNNEISGTVSKERRSLTFEEGFEVYCQYSQNLMLKTLEGYADGKVTCIQYNDKKCEASITTTSTPREFNMSRTVTEISKITTLMRTWSEGVVFEGCHEDYLSRIDKSSFIKS